MSGWGVPPSPPVGCNKLLNAVDYTIRLPAVRAIRSGLGGLVGTCDALGEVPLPPIDTRWVNESDQSRRCR